MSEDKIEWTIDPEMIKVELDIGEPQSILAHLLLNSILFLNYDWDAPINDPIRETIKLLVICSDTFAYACADCEQLPYDQIIMLYLMWQKDPIFGATAWCITRRKELPLRHWVKKMEEMKIWDLGKLLLGDPQVVIPNKHQAIEAWLEKKP